MPLPLNPDLQGKFYRAIFHHLPYGLFVVDEDLRLVMCNGQGQLAEILNAKKGDSSRCYEVFCPEQHRPCPECPVLDVLRRGLPNSRKKCRPVDGLLEMSAFPLPVPGPRMVLLAEEVGVRSVAKQLEEQVLQSEKMAQVGRLAQGLVHDFNNLLLIIGGHSEQLLKLLQEPHLEEMARTIQEAAERAGILVRQLHHLTRRATDERTAVDLNALLVSWEGFIQKALGPRIVLTLGLDQRLRPVWAHKEQIEQLVLNLVVNAGDAMPEGGNLLLGTENAQTPWGEQVVKLTVRDNGCGMEAAVRDNIFEPFYTTKDTDRGTGLGLPTVSAILQAHGGTIDVETAPNRGTTFTVFLPCQDGKSRHDLTSKPI